ncbi:MAG: hypothetical protein ACRDJN_11550, partial [Chloroflexota bacterium]
FQAGRKPSRTAPYHLSWTEAFFQSLEYRLQRALATGNAAVCGSEGQLRAFAEAHQRRWVPPREYVLSHFDGLQGMAKHDGRRWVFTGHVDLEDVSFTDARFPLAGYELGVEGRERRRRVPTTFWDGYHAHKAADPSYEAVRDVFKLYYLLEWFPMAYDPRWSDGPADMARSIRRFESAIVDLVTGVW